MMLADRLPYVTAANGRRYVRRHQLDVIANVREARAIEEAVGGGVRLVGFGERRAPGHRDDTPRRLAEIPRPRDGY